MNIRQMRTYCCLPNTLLVIKTRFATLSLVTDRVRAAAAASTALRMLLFPPLRRKKWFVLNEIVAVHAAQLEGLSGHRQKNSSWVVFLGTERVPNQNEIENSLNVAAESARHAAEHSVVGSLIIDNRC